MADRWFPGSFVAPLDPQAARLDNALQKAFQQIYALQDLLNGIKSGASSVTGSATIATGLSKVSQVVATIDNGAAASNLWVTVQISPAAGSVVLSVWQPTAAGNTTPIAATSAVTIRWIAVGNV